VLPDVRDIRINHDADAKAFGSSSTAGKTGRVAGRADVSGSFELYTASDQALPFSVGDTGTLLLTTGDTAVDGNGEELLNEAVIITQIDSAIPIEDGELVSRRVSFAQQAR
jgi:hypothetical protein